MKFLFNEKIIIDSERIAKTDCDWSTPLFARCFLGGREQRTFGMTPGSSSSPTIRDLSSIEEST